MFDPVDPRQSFPELERGILAYWKEQDLFRRSVSARKGGETFSFFDGPPFATGLPHYGHLLAGTIKDVIPRYQTMRGKQVQRRFGWDCHGLPVEYEIEKEHHLKSRRDIEKMGVANFNALCRGIVQRYTREWQTTVERMGRWVDMDWDYRTMDPDYMESIWWVFSELWKKELMYEGHKPMHICPRCGTALSNFEVTQGYKDVTDQTATAMFKVTGIDAAKAKFKSTKNVYMLAWTTTPWTLPGNLFVAVGPKISYAIVTSGDARFIVAKDRIEAVFADKEHEVEMEVKGTDLIGITYEPLFPYFVKTYGESSFRVVGGDFVTTEDGTGLVHIAPGFGEDDFQVGKKEDVPLLQHVTMDGRFVDAVTDFAGVDVKPKDDPSKTDRAVIEHLTKNGSIFSTHSFRHSYPHCWRCDSPLLNYTTSSWFVRVEKIKEDLLAVNKETEWVPHHIRDGRFGKWLEGARDWSISRNRYWGTPLPIWRTDSGEVEVIGSRTELMERAKIRFTKVTALRHGESEGNLVPVYQGKEPGTNLTAEGKKQALAAAKELKTQGVDIIYCSPLARTRQTAEIIAKETGAKLIVDERLREVSFGEYEGKTIDFSDLKIVNERRASKLKESSPESIYHFAGMENWGSVHERVSSFLKEMLPRHRSEHVVVVSHADPIVTMRHFFSKEDPFKLSHQPFPPYATPYTFFWDHVAEHEVDLHKEFVDTVTWNGAPSEKDIELTVVRHGETDFNKEERIQGGQKDPPLNATGRSQAETIAKELKGKKFDVVLVSDRIRAKETADIIVKELGLNNVETWNALTEREAGEWAGKLKEDVYREFPAYPGCDAVSWHYATPKGGESLSQLLTRAESAQEEILKRFPGKKVLVVAHRGTLLSLLAVAENYTYAELAQKKVKNTEVVEMTLRPRFKRIPEVLDCWFESGSMPYAQQHYPFKSGEAYAIARQGKATKGLPFGFPADFIAEGIDQTRGWFYTLTVLSAALFKKPAFHHCVVNGIVLAEDGRKMSKRLKNYPEPTLLIDKFGADALRFALMSSPAVRGEDLRFSEKFVEETVRSVILPLWNAYGFFVTYANTCNFDPATRPGPSPHPLDRFIVSEVQDLCNRMTEQLETYDLSATCAELHDTIDALTNWYIRLSRRRFAGKATLDAAEANTEDHSEDQHQALSTLYEVLTTLTQLLAPFCPFVTEAMYLNLVHEDHGSIHLTKWPEPRKLKKEETVVLARHRLMRDIVSLGMTVRSESKVKVRQPLAKATIAVPPTALEQAKLGEEDISLLRQELNVKEIEFTKDPGKLADIFVQVDARKVGPRLGSRVQEIIAAGKRGEFTVQPDGSVLIGEEMLSPDEAPVRYRGREGENVAAHKGVVVSIDTRVTDALKLEGAARDLIRGIQKLRKESGMSVTDPIALSVEGAEDVMETFGELIAQETNATISKNGGEPQTIDLDGTTATVRLEKR